MSDDVSDHEKFVQFIHYIGSHPIRSGRVGLAAIMFHADFDAYAQLGKPITGHAYVKAREPGEKAAPRGIFDAIRTGRRWGSVGYRITVGKLTRADAEWIAHQWRDGVPV